MYRNPATVSCLYGPAGQVDEDLGALHFHSHRTYSRKTDLTFLPSRNAATRKSDIYGLPYYLIAYPLSVLSGTFRSTRRESEFIQPLASGIKHKINYRTIKFDHTTAPPSDPDRTNARKRPYKMRKRMKAQDVFNETEPLLGGKTTFSKAFPEIANITLEVDQGGRKRTYGKANFPGEFVNCSNPLCYNGGVRIGSIINDMTFDRDTEYEGSLSCQGHEGSPKGRRNYGPCLNRFKVKIIIEYVPPPAS